MLGLCAFGGLVYPTSAIAVVAQSPTIKVSGQVVDEQGLPLLGATIRIKDGQTGTKTGQQAAQRKLPDIRSTASAG